MPPRRSISSAESPARSAASSPSTAASLPPGRSEHDPMRTFIISLLLFAFSLLVVPSLAMAQSKPRIPLRVAAPPGGTILRPAAAAIAAPEALWKKIQAANAADLKYAKALADSVASPGARLRSACYAALIVTIEQAQGE